MSRLSRCALLGAAAVALPFASAAPGVFASNRVTVSDGLTGTHRSAAPPRRRQQVYLGRPLGDSLDWVIRERDRFERSRQRS